MEFQRSKKPAINNTLQISDTRGYRSKNKITIGNAGQDTMNQSRQRKGSAQAISAMKPASNFQRRPSQREGSFVLM